MAFFGRNWFSPAIPGFITRAPDRHQPILLHQAILRSSTLKFHESFFASWKATYWRSFFRNDRHWPSFPVLPVHEIPTSRDESSPDLTTCLSSCNYFGSIAQNFPLPTWFKLNVNSLYATLTSNFSIRVSVSPLPFRSILLFSVWSREIRLTV